MNFEWTDARVEQLTKLHNQRYSAGVIARMIGGITRNAVIGKIHRLGLPRNLSKPISRVPHPGWGRTKVGAKPVVERPAKARRMDLPTEPLPIEDTPKGPLVMFADLEPHQCRAPYGDPKQAGFGFCGCKVSLGLPYCEDHARRFYRASEPVRRYHDGKNQNVNTAPVPAMSLEEVMA